MVMHDIFWKRRLRKFPDSFVSSLGEELEWLFSTIECTRTVKPEV